MSEKKYCIYCGALLTTRQQLYCSQACAEQFHREELIQDILQGQADWRWLWPDRRFEILKRDHFTCQVCGKHDNSLNLQVHHITPLSKGGNCLDPKNLITLCYACHRQTFNRYHGYAGIPKKQAKLRILTKEV